MIFKIRGVYVGRATADFQVRVTVLGIYLLVLIEDVEKCIVDLIRFHLIRIEYELLALRTTSIIVILVYGFISPS